MATTIRLPIDLNTPNVSANAGNCFWSVTGLTAWDFGHWEFVKDVVGKIFGTVQIPPNVAATPAAKIVLELAWNATTGVARMSVAVECPADGQTINPSSLQAPSSVDITVPGTARFRKTQSITLGTSGGNLPVAANDILIVQVQHEGTHAYDSVAVNSELIGAWLEIDVN